MLAVKLVLKMEKVRVDQDTLANFGNDFVYGVLYFEFL